ncbi:MAG: NAD(P)H-binding protein [Thermodesulfovibrionales bacterium]|nr:NAD(P)H-binding protein [Thermodesulfovibrionales bacterium]
MPELQTHAVTGALGYSGRYIAQRLLDKGHDVISLTSSSRKDSSLAEKIDTRPFHFDEPDKLTKALQGVSVLYNTYWVRFNHEMFTHSDAVRNTLVLFESAKQAGVERIVHISITNPSAESNLEYFREKAVLEKALIETGISYAILRPAVIFGKEDILINNIAWFLRNFPVFGVFGDGEYKIQPIYVDDLAGLAIDHGERRENIIVNAIGPETFTYKGLVEEICRALGINRKIMSISPWLGHLVAKIIGRLVGDVIVTRPEIEGLMSNCLYVDSTPTGTTALSKWARENAGLLGKHYHNELARRRRVKKPSEGGAEMRTTILEIYALIVCLPSIFCLSILASIGLYDIVQIIFPEFTLGGSGNIIAERQSALQSLVIVLISGAVSLAVFSLHWLIGNKAREAR